MSSKKAIRVISIILFNIVPITGVAFYNWSPFEMFWLFWMETLIISFFNAVKILFSQERTVVTRGESISLQYNVAHALRYLLIRLVIFLFYSIFIITFIGFVAHKERDPVQVIRTLAFQNLLFNLALLLIICTNLFYLLKYFFFSGAYLYARKNAYSGFFDGRQIVIHVAVVLGAVGSAFLFNDGNSPYAAVWIISILCIAKCIFELFFLKQEDHLDTSHN